MWILKYLIFFTLAFTSYPAIAREMGQGECQKPGECEEPKREVCFNLLCSYYDSDHDAEPRSCKAAARFNKTVTKSGREVEDNSVYPNNPDFEIECDGVPIHNNGGRRFTDYLGTRIQAHRGPYPALLLPRGSLRDEHFYVNSTLELSQSQRMRGYCFLYTGPQNN